MLAIPPARSENDWVQRAAEFRARVSRLSGETKIVFVRPSARTNHHFVLVANEYPPDRSATWVVRDVGPERDDLLRRSAPLRVAWLYDEETKRFSLLPAARVAARTR
jgi:hypothetical protein